MAIETGSGIIIGMALLSIIIAFICFFILAMTSSNVTLKVFFFTIAGLLFILTLGMFVTILENDTTGFTKFTSLFRSTYTMFLWLFGAASIGLILWLIYATFQYFYKLRGVVPHD